MPPLIFLNYVDTIEPIYDKIKTPSNVPHETFLAKRIPRAVFLDFSPFLLELVKLFTPTDVDRPSPDIRNQVRT